MVVSSKNYRELLLKKIGTFRTVTLVVTGFLTLIIALGIVVSSYYSATTGGGNLSLYLIGISLIMIVSLGVFGNYFFKSYMEVLQVMTNEDLETLARIAESRTWLEKYLPSFIIYAGKVRVFKLYSQPDVFFTELREISIRSNYFNRGPQNKLVIFKNLAGKTYFFGMDSNPIQRQHLLDKALAYNPNIIINNM